MATCPTCGAEVEVGQRFCGECGTKLSVVRPQPAEGDGSNAAPRRPADIGAGGFRWNASTPAAPSEVLRGASVNPDVPSESTESDDFFSRYRAKAGSPSAPEQEGAAAAEPDTSFLRSRRRFNPDLRATGERDVVGTPPAAAPAAGPEGDFAPVVPRMPRPPMRPAAPQPEPEAEVEAPAPAAAEPAVDPRAAARNAFSFEPPTTEFDVLPMQQQAAAPARADDAESAPKVPTWFSELDGAGAESAPTPSESAAPQAPAPRAFNPPVAEAPQFGRPPDRAPDARADVPAPPPMPATGDPFRGASAAPVFPTGPAMTPGEPSRTPGPAGSGFDELLTGERSDGSTLDESDRPIVSRDFEQTGIVPLPSRTRETFGAAEAGQQRDAQELFAAPTAPPSPTPIPQAPAAPVFPSAQQPDVERPAAEPQTRILPQQAPAQPMPPARPAPSTPPGTAAPSADAEPGEGRELLSSWFSEEDDEPAPDDRATSETRRQTPAAAAPARGPALEKPRQAPVFAPVADADDREGASGSNPFDRVGAALGGGSGGGGGRFGQAVRGLDRPDRRRLGIIALSVVGSILLIISALIIGTVVNGSKTPVAEDSQTAAPSESAPGEESTAPETPALPPAVADTSFAPVSFQSESGNIRCQITPEAGVACQQYTLGFTAPDEVCQGGATGVIVGLDSNGYTFPCLTTDIEGATVQPYDSPVVAGEFQCTISFDTGVTCFNASGDIVSVEYSAGIGQAGRLSATNPAQTAAQ